MNENITPLHNVIHNSSTQSNGIIISRLILIVVFFSMFSRLFSSIGVPAAVNFLHFIFIALVFFLVLTKLKTSVSVGLVVGVFLLLAAVLISALVNEAGLINIILDFLLIAEPFMLLIAMTSTRWRQSNVEGFRFWLIVIIVVHVLFAYYQRIVFGYTDDDVEGLFINMGAGSHLAGAVALTAAAYILFSFQTRPIWLRVLSAILCVIVVIMSDAKQVIAVFLVSIIIMLFFKISNFKKILQYLLFSTVFIAVIIIAANTIFPGLTVWANIDKLLEGIGQKLLVFPVVISYYDSGLNWIFGLGPGHTVGRLGWLTSDYSNYLEQLGITTLPVTDAVWNVQQGNYISNSTTGSSMFSLFFSWAGVWGDLGVFGLSVYLLLWLGIWRKICTDDLSKYFLLTILVFGGVFSWMEEPEYMIFMMVLIGLRWQENEALKYLYINKVR